MQTYLKVKYCSYPKVLLSRGLLVKNTKTKEHVINNDHNSWKKCKLHRSLLDTIEDIKRRKTAITAANNIEHVFKSKESHKYQKHK